MRFRREGLIGRWQDRKKRPLEEFLDGAMAALAQESVNIRHRLAHEAEQERQRQTEIDRRRREHERHERSLLRNEYLLRKSAEYQRLKHLSELQGVFERGRSWTRNEPADVLLSELRTLVDVLKRGFERSALNEEIVRLQLLNPEDIDDDE